MLRLLSFAALLVVCASATNAQTNAPAGIFNNFLNTIQNAQQRQQAQDAWNHTDPGIVACMKQSYSPPPETLAANGVAPTDPRISAFYNRCVQSVATQRQQQEAQQQQATQQQQAQQQQAIQQQHAAEQRRQQEAQADADRQKQQEEDRIKQQKADEVRQKAEAAAKAKADADERKKKEQADADEKKRREATSKLRGDPALLSVLDPDRRTITVLVVGKDTQNIVRNLKGQPVFQKPVSACFPFGAISADPSTIEWRFLDSLKDRIAGKGGAAIEMTLCAPDDIGKYDLIMFSGAQVGDGSFEVLTSLVEALRKRDLVLFEKYSIAAFEAQEHAKLAAAAAEEQRQKAEREEAVKSFQIREPAIISAIYLQSPASTVCLITSGDVEGLRYMLQRPDSPFADLAGHGAFREYPSADAVFIALKKQECVAAIAPAGNLKDIAAALGRDGVPIEVHPASLGPDRLANWRNIKAEGLAKAQEQEQQRVAEERRTTEQHNIEEQQKRVLEQERQKTDEAARREELERMRTKVESTARAVMEGFTERLKRHMNSVVTEVNDTRERAKLGQVLSTQAEKTLRAEYDADRVFGFESRASSFESRAKEGWEFGDIRAELEDYGLAQWKSRQLAAIAVKIEIPMVQRAIGERGVDCEVFFWINDEEFGYRRQTGVVECSKFDRNFAVWSQQNIFESEWKLLAPDNPVKTTIPAPSKQSGSLTPASPPDQPTDVAHQLSPPGLHPVPKTPS